MDPRRKIGLVEFLHEDDVDFLGVRVYDRKKQVIAEKVWNVEEQDKAEWSGIAVPPDQEIIGVFGTHNGSVIKSLGLILWTPNPNAKLTL